MKGEGIDDGAGGYFLCMICGKPAVDSYAYTPPSGTVDQGGPHWVYCRPCDCWTEHPEPTAHKKAPVEWRGGTTTDAGH